MGEGGGGERELLDSCSRKQKGKKAKSYINRKNLPNKACAFSRVSDSSSRLKVGSSA